MARIGSGLGAGIVILFANGCATYPVFPNADAHIPTLMSGEVVFGETIDPAAETNLLTMSEDMHDFLENADIFETNIRYTRFRRLIGGLIKGGYFSNAYVADGTYSAARTFRDGRGNCLGYTNMFITLARAAGLSASYQLIEDHPLWNMESGHLIRNNHINVVINDISLPGKDKARVVVDFNVVQPDPEFAETVLVSDDFAKALFYVNIGVDYIAQGDYRNAFAQLKRGALTDPNNKFVWNNVGFVYSKLGKPALAQKAYELALSLDAEDKSALAGMVVALTAQGRQQEAASYERRVHWYQMKNPFYHFAIAKSAFTQARFGEALLAVEGAIDLKEDEARFFALRAAVAAELGDEELAERSLQLADQFERRSRNEAMKPNAKFYSKYDGRQKAPTL